VCGCVCVCERERERGGNVVCSQQGHFETRLFTEDTISYFQEVLLKETWEVIHQEHDLNKIFSNIL